jgi:hypothetical protein
MIRKVIKPGTQFAVKLSVRERDLVVERAFLDPELETTLREAVPIDSRLVINMNLDDIDDLLGCVAAEANHSDDAKVQRVLDAVCDRLSDLLDGFTDQPSTEPPVAKRPPSRFTSKQGQ